MTQERHHQGTLSAIRRKETEQRLLGTHTHSRGEPSASLAVKLVHSQTREQEHGAERAGSEAGAQAGIQPRDPLDSFPIFGLEVRETGQGGTWHISMRS